MLRRQFLGAVLGLQGAIKPLTFGSIAHPLAHLAVLPVCPTCGWPIRVPPPPYPQGLIPAFCQQCDWQGETRLQMSQPSGER